MFQDSEKISSYQAMMLVIGSQMGALFMFIARPCVESAGRDGWLALLIAYAIATLFGLLLIDLGRRFPDKTFIQYLPLVLGGIPGKLAALIYILIFWYTTPLVFRVHMELIRFFLPKTPPITIIISFALIVIYCMKKGFETFARSVELFTLTTIVSLLILIVMIFPSCDFKNLQPFLENGFSPIINSVPSLFPFASEGILFMALWLPCLNTFKKVKKSFLLGTTISTLILTTLVILSIGFSGDKFVSKQIFPTFYLAQNVVFGDIIYGIEGFLLLAWVIACTVTNIFFSYSSIVGLAQLLNLREYKHLIFPMTFINVVLAMIPSSITEVMNWSSIKNPFLFLPLSLLIPFTWLIALIRKKDESNSKGKKRVN